MIEHLLIAFFAPMLIVVGAPWIPLLFAFPVGAPAVGRSLAAARTLVRRAPGFGRVVLNRWTALLAFNAVMVLWHLPALFDSAETNQLVHIWLMHASFFVTGVLFWLQIIPSYPFRMRATPVVADRGAHRHQPRHVRPGHVVVDLLGHQLVLGVRPRAGGVPLAVRRPADRRGDPVDLRGLLGRARR